MPQKKREVKYKDANMYHEAVLFYRETFDKCPNAGFRRDIAVTVKTYDDLLIWQNLLAHWGYFKNGKWKPRNPLDVKGMLTCFEFKQRDAKHQRRSLSTAANQRQVCGNDSSESMERERIHWQMPSLLDREVR